MSYFFCKKTTLKITALSLVTFLIACSKSSDSLYATDNNQKYLAAIPLKPLVVPQNMSLPTPVSDYTVPTNVTGTTVGKKVDIRPPLQPLVIFDYSEGSVQGDTATLLVNGTAPNALWGTLLNVLAEKGYSIAKQQDQQQTILTNWISWPNSYLGRYQITLKQTNNSYIINVKLLELTFNKQTVTSAADVQRYATLMLNTITTGLQQQQLDAEKAKTQATYQVENGLDDNGLPVLIIRAPYVQAWQYVLTKLPEIGIQITSRSQAKGDFSVKYKNPGNNVWHKLGVTDPNIDNGKYMIQLGDLGNRTSITVLKNDGSTLESTQTQAFDKAIQALLSGQ